MIAPKEENTDSNQQQLELVPTEPPYQVVITTMNETQEYANYQLVPVTEATESSAKDALAEKCREFVKRMNKMRREQKQKILIRHKKLE